jgi:preprotein translocase subunit YajC
MSYLILPLLLLAMYFLVIRPQQQRIRAQQALVAALEVGDEVVSSAGIYGRITSLSDEIATLEVADGVELRLARGAVARRLPRPGELTADADPVDEPEPVDGLDLTDRDDPEAGR